MTLTCRTQRLAGSDLGFLPEHLARLQAPSIRSMFLIRPDDERCYRYDPYQHTLHNIPCRPDVRQVMDSMQDVLPALAATLLLFAAPGILPKVRGRRKSHLEGCRRTTRSFRYGLGGFGHQLCPLGVTGEPWVGQLIDQPGLAGVGAAFVGSRPS
jgi:hypothetical protein